MNGPDAGRSNALQDFVVGVVLVIVSTAMVYLSIMLPRPAGWVSAPGLTPMIVFSIVGVLGAALAVKAVNVGALSQLSNVGGMLRSMTTANSARRLTVLIGLMFVYFLVLPSYLPFELSTFAFLLAALFAFYSGSVLIKFAVAAAVPLVFSLFFSNVFGAFLPGVEWREFAPALHGAFLRALEWFSIGI